MKYLIITFLVFFNFGYSQSWQNVGNGLNDNVYDIQKYGNRLYVGGRIGVKYWNDTTWNSLPNPFGIAYPLSLAIYNDSLYVGGDFPWSGSISHVYKYDGSSWVQVGGAFNAPSWSSTKKLITYNNKLISAGHFTSITGNSIVNIASWNGVNWEGLGNGLNGIVTNLAEHNGELYASGNFTASGSDTLVKSIARWDGSNWRTLDINHRLKSAGPMISFNGLLFIGNVWDTINGFSIKGIASWDGNNFTSKGNNLIHGVSSFWVFNQELYLSGSLYTLNPYAYKNVVLKWNGYFWEQVGNEFDDAVLAIEDYKNEIFCAGFYDLPNSHISKLNTSLSIGESREKKIHIYPNPANEYIIVRSEFNGNLKIINEMGALVQETQINNEERLLSTLSLQSGIYFLIFQSENGYLTQKLIIQK